MKDAFTIWFTGPTRSGKSAIGEWVAQLLRARQYHVEIIDSGRIRKQINRDLGFTKAEITTNILRIGYDCKILNRNGVVAIVVAVSPFREARDAVREQVGEFIEVYCDCPVEELMKRDTSGLLQQAKEGGVQNVAGINAPYEEPFKPEVHLRTSEMTIEEAANLVITTLELLEKVDRIEPSAYTPEEEEMIRKRLTDLGYLE